MASPIRVTVWHEYRHEHKNETVAKHYPDGMHAAMKLSLIHISEPTRPY